MSPLFAVQVQTWVLGVLVAAVGLSVGALWLQLGNKTENLRRELIQFMSWLKDEGFVHAPNLVEDIVVSDLSTALKRLVEWFRAVKDPAVRKTILVGFLTRQLELRLSDPQSRSQIYEIMQKYELLKDAERRAIAAEYNAKTQTAAPPATAAVPPAVVEAPKPAVA